MTSRREFLGQSAVSALAASGVHPGVSRLIDVDANAPVAGFRNIQRVPDRVTVEIANASITLQHAGNGTWRGDHGIVVTTIPSRSGLSVALTAPGAAIKRINVRWRAEATGNWSISGDAWERAYGDLEWRGWVPDRVMPWYFAASNNVRTDAYGVRTNPNAFCCWYADPNGITLSADVRSGGVGVQLGDRTLAVCEVICRAGRAGESAFAALHSFCKMMCTAPRLPATPIYGSNDWYWAYGNNSAVSVRTDAARIVELSPTGANRPYTVIDDGWQPDGGHDKNGSGQWDRGNEKFGEMSDVASAIHAAGARAGIWIRPLQAPNDAPASWRLSRDRTTLDPSVPEARAKIAKDIARLREWGFDMIKHDYSTFDIFGRWGLTMGSALTRDGWTFAAGSTQTTAEILGELYRTIRTAAGTSIVIGCNTVGHLAAGHFEIARVGDDTSGTDWMRTRKMGVNALAFRAAQHNAFHVADGDCVGVTTEVPWALNRQWLDLLARSGTMLLVSLATDALGAEQRRDLRAALAIASVPQPLAEPLDWQRNILPSRWRLMGHEQHYDWYGASS